MGVKNTQEDIRRREREFSRIVEAAAKPIEADIAAVTGVQKVWCGHFGATGIDPKHLFIYFVLPARDHVAQLRMSAVWDSIKAQLRQRLDDYGYPVAALQEHWVDLFSQEECDDVADGNWYHFFK